MAEVYRAEQTLTGGISRPVALKVIRPEYSESADFREMFLDEARTACTLNHPNIAHIYEVGEVDGLLYMAMELVTGAPLSTVARTLHSRGERLTDEGLLAVGIFTCAALEAVHAHQELVHRDVSPQNILLAPNGTLKLIDFGIAQAATNRNLTQVGTTKGKAGYFSPEQAMGKKLDGRSDLFSLGITLYQLAAGTTPLDVNSNVTERHSALVKGKWEPLERVCPGLPRGFYAVVGRSLQVKPEDRYPDAAAMREDLEAAALGAGLAVGPSSLAGYVQEQSGAFSVIPTGVKRPRGSLVGVPNTPSRPREPAFLQKQPVRAALGVVTALALVGGGLVVWKGLQRPKPVPHPVTEVTPPTPPSTPPKVAVAEAAPRDSVPPEVKASPSSAPSLSEDEVVPVPKPGRERTRRETRRPSPASAPTPSVTAKTPAPAPEEVLTGEGVLRIKATTGTAVEVKLPGRGREALPISIQRMAAGTHTAEFFISGGTTARCVVKVRPDRRTVVTFDGKSCAVEYL
ncbi:Serine/threonine protein kinase PrkC, regulator of stationary phase [Hyalangium minutum]|uniref:Serine/threonine protein kinase PrkC, regulator of stationary phase n=2 Tax=Hyalangium minutum TaxID=394096 RepID=A0A085W494_9BACT|nr:Serine/threonine protein kinase PrkC, regulator of stationary phase [Hyalangium minutum]